MKSNLINKKPYNFSTSLIYSNSKIHIGHLYEITILDIFSKFWKILKFKTNLISGTDDHGIKLKNQSIIKKKNAILISNYFSNKYLLEISKLKILIKDWIKTSYKKHIFKIKFLILKITRYNKYIYKQSYFGWYLPETDSYYSNKEINFLNNQMFSYKNIPVEWIEEESFYFNSSLYKIKTILLFRSKSILTPKISIDLVQNIILNTENFCITRTINNYGIKFKKSGINFILWVWIDALLNYTLNLNKYNFVHFIGKDIFKFHVSYYIPLLLSLNYKLPNVIYCHGFITYKTIKLSKILNNYQINKSLNYEPYLIRYYFLSKNILNDFDYNKKEIEKINNDLCNNLGNLIKRVINLLKNKSIIYLFSLSDLIIIKYYKLFLISIKSDILNFNSSNIFKIFDNYIIKINSYITQNQPWKKNNKRSYTNLYILNLIILNLIDTFKPILTNAKNITLNYFLKNTKYNPFIKY